MKSNVKKILLISHNFNVAGAPYSLLGIAKILKSKYNVTVFGLSAGPLTELYKKELGETPRIINQYEDNYLKQELKKYDFVYINTIVGYNIANICKNQDVPFIWVLRESQNIPQVCEVFNIDKAALKKILKSCKKSTYCVSDYAKKYIDKTFNINIGVMHNFVEDTYLEQNFNKQASDKLFITLLGTHEYRKGVHILIDAITPIADKCVLNLCGNVNEQNKYVQTLISKTKNNKNIIWHGIIEGVAKQKILHETDVFVIPSYDESCSRVVLEGMMMGKPVIVTENVGAKYMVNKNSGWIVKTGDVESLKKCIENIINHPEILPEMGKAARQMYLKTSTPQIYEKRLLKIINRKILQYQCRKIFSLKNLFSVKNKDIRKIITIFGIKFKFKSKKLIERKRFANLENNVASLIDKIDKQESNITKLETLLQNQNECIKNLTKQINEQINNVYNDLKKQSNEIIYAEVLKNCTENSNWLKKQDFTLTLGAANYSFIFILFKILDEIKPKNILEMGLGQTSKLTSQYANFYQNSFLDIVEHNQEWIDIFCQKLKLSENINVHHKNLIDFVLNDVESDKYDSLKDVIQSKKYDLIIIDGPFGFDRTYPRTNILELIPHNLADEFVIVLDDAERQGEKNTANLIFQKLDENNIKYKKSYKVGLKTQLVITSLNYEYIHWF